MKPNKYDDQVIRGVKHKTLKYFVRNICQKFFEVLRLLQNVTCKHNLSNADTCLKRTKISVPKVSALDKFHSNFGSKILTKLRIFLHRLSNISVVWIRSKNAKKERNLIAFDKPKQFRFVWDNILSYVECGSHGNLAMFLQ